MSFYFQSICKKTKILFRFKLKFSPLAIIIMPDLRKFIFLAKLLERCAGLKKVMHQKIWEGIRQSSNLLSKNFVYWSLVNFISEHYGPIFHSQFANNSMKHNCQGKLFGILDFWTIKAFIDCTQWSLNRGLTISLLPPTCQLNSALRNVVHLWWNCPLLMLSCTVISSLLYFIAT